MHLLLEEGKFMMSC